MPHRMIRLVPIEPKGVRGLFNIEDTRPVIEALGSSPLVISPWLAYVGGRVRFDSYIFDLLYWGARDFANANWRREYVTRVFGTLPIPSRFPRTAIYETAASTAVYLAYEQTGQPIATDRHAKDALHLTEDFVLKHGFDYYIAAYSLLTMYENHLAVHYYGKMLESDFLSGRLHRPWIDYPLDDELIVSCEIGTIELFVEGNERYVRLTDLGRERLEQYRTMLNETGYLRKRSQSLRISHFSELEDYELVVSRLAPNVDDLRTRLLAFANIRPGMRVLELGCGSGPTTFECGLADLVRPDGEIIATDPAHKMIQRAIEKRNTLNKPWVEFVQTRAEELPFPDESFDAVIGMLFIHLTDHDRVLSEVRRVLKPGGQFSTMHPLRFPMDNPLVKEWFEPISQIASRDAEDRLLPDVETIPAAFKKHLSQIESEQFTAPNIYDDPDTVVRFFIESLGLFDDELIGLPWAERANLIRTLKEKGEQICATHTTEELTIRYPVQMVRGIKL